MASFGVGSRHESLHIIVFHVPAALVEFLNVADDAVAVVGFRLVAHLVVHPGLFAVEHPLGEADAVEDLGHLDAGDVAQGVEDVHHQQVLLRGNVHLLNGGRHLVSGGLHSVLEASAELAQFADQQEFDHHGDSAYLGIRQIIVVLLLPLFNILVERLLVDLEAGVLEKILQEPPQLLLPCGSDGQEALSAQVLLHLLLLFADYIIIVQHPFVGAAHQTLVLRLRDKQIIITCYLLDTFLEFLICAFTHNLQI